MHVNLNHPTFKTEALHLVSNGFCRVNTLPQSSLAATHNGLGC